MNIHEQRKIGTKIEGGLTLSCFCGREARVKNSKKKLMFYFCTESHFSTTCIIMICNFVLSETDQNELVQV